MAVDKVSDCVDGVGDLGFDSLELTFDELVLLLVVATFDTFFDSLAASAPSLGTLLAFALSSPV
jgi:hypothetical protein